MVFENKNKKFTILKNMVIEKPNKWITCTDTGNETRKLTKLLERVGRDIKMSFKSNNKLNNLIWNKIEKSSNIKCNKFYIGKINRNFKSRFKEHERDFMYSGEKSYIKAMKCETMKTQ